MRTTLESNKTYNQRQHQTRYSHVAQTLTGVYVIPPEGATFQFLNPNGSNRTVFLPPYTPDGGSVYWMSNTGSSGDLNVVDTNGVAVVTIGAGGLAPLIEGRNAWKAFLDSTNKQDKVGTARFPGVAATVTILTSDQEVGIDTSSTAVSANLPTATSWAAANPNGLELVIFDNTGQGASNNITPVPSGAEIFRGGLTPLVTTAYGLIKLRPIPGIGWYLR